MEKIYSLKNLKSAKNNFLFLGLLASSFFSPTILNAQTKGSFTLRKTLQTLPIKSVSIDRYFNFYVADDKGNVFRYDSLGKEALRYSPQKKAEISLIESWRSVNIFLFYRELQEFNILDRFLTTSSPNFKFVNEVEDTKNSIGFARLATIAADNNLWIYDEEDFSIKKYNTTTNDVLITTPLELILDPQTYDLSYIREYQNLLFISDKNSGILIFDNLGNYKTKMEIKGLSSFNFLNNSIYYIDNGNLIIKDIYSGKSQTYPTPDNKKFDKVLLSNSSAYFFGKDNIEIYQFIR